MSGAQDESTKPRAIAQLDDGAARLIWIPPRPMTAGECERDNYPEGTVTKGRIVVESKIRDELGVAAWYHRYSFDEAHSLYPLVLKLRAALEGTLTRHDRALDVLVAVRALVDSRIDVEAVVVVDEEMGALIHAFRAWQRADKP